MSVTLFVISVILLLLWIILTALCMRVLYYSLRDEIGKRRQVKEILRAHPLLKEQLLKRSKLTDEQMRHEPDMVEEIIKNIPAHVLQVLSVAGSQKDIDLDLDTVVVREKTLFPTRDIEPVPMSSMEQVSDILPEQLLMEDDQFYNALANDELLVLQPYERVVEKKTLHVSLDLSGSMKTPMADMKARHNWSRGVTLSLLLKAINGEATYLLRGFASQPYDLRRVANADEAHALIDELLQMGADGVSTDIYSALHQAVTDVRANKDPGDVADIMLITDGLDNNGEVSAANLRTLFGRDVRLHVAAIGETSPALQSVATSYQVFK